MKTWSVQLVYHNMSSWPANQQLMIICDRMWSTPQRQSSFGLALVQPYPRIPAACRSLPVGSSVVHSCETVRDLGVWFDSELSMKTHINKVVSICYYHLCSSSSSSSCSGSGSGSSTVSTVMFIFVAGSQLSIWCLWQSFCESAIVSTAAWRTVQWHSYKLGSSVGDGYYKGIVIVNLALMLLVLMLIFPLQNTSV